MWLYHHLVKGHAWIGWSMIKFEDIGIGQSFVHHNLRYIKLPEIAIPWSASSVNAYGPTDMGVYGYYWFNNNQYVEEYDPHKRGVNG